MRVYAAWVTRGCLASRPARAEHERMGLDEEIAATLPDLPDADELEAIASRRPGDAAMRALEAMEAIERARRQKAVALLRAEPPEIVLAGARHKEARWVSRRVTERPVRPAYR